jgi:peroxiredoxin
MAISAPPGNLGWKAPDFELTDTFGAYKTLETLRGPSGLVLMFICNHCPYVKAIIDRICRDVAEIQAMGIGVAAIMSNDTHAYPEDSFANMQKMAKSLNFSFPYLYDPTQNVARNYGAVCTPDFYGFNRDLELQYRGRLDSSEIAPATSDARRELVEAMRQIAATGRSLAEQVACVGCSIKWSN